MADQRAAARIAQRGGGNPIAWANQFPCHCFARALKAQRSLKTMDVMSVCITVKRQGTP